MELVVNKLVRGIQEALQHSWLKGETATDYDILPEIKSYIAKARLRRGIEMVKLTNRIEALRMHDDDPGGDLPSDAQAAAKEGVTKGDEPKSTEGPGRLSKAARHAIFRAVVLAKVKEMKAEEEKKLTERTLSEKRPASGKK